MIKTINLDMDGVICNFNGKIKEITGKTFEQFGVSSDAWKAIHGQECDIYQNLELLEDAETLVAGILLFAKKNNYRVSILTGLPKGNRVPMAEIHKREWLRTKLPMFSVLQDNFMIGPWSEDKWKHCYTSQDILIDDYYRNISDWTNKGGGIAIHHMNAQDTIERLKELEKIL